MDRRAKLVAAALSLVASGAYAFVSPSPPPGFGGSPGAWTHTPPSAAQQIGKIMRGPGPMIPGAGASSAAVRLGPGAARALAGGVARALIPGVGLVLGVAWLASNCYEKQGGQWVRTCFPDSTPSDGYKYSNSVEGGAKSYPSPQAACEGAAAWLNSNSTAYTHTVSQCQAPPSVTESGQIYIREENKQTGAVRQIPHAVSKVANPSCPVGWYWTPAGCLQQLQPQPVTPEQIEDDMASKPLPQTLPPGFPYPLDPLAPSIWNPEPITETPPGVDPKSRPWRVPQGDPQPIPNTNPQQYRQPVTRWTHSPTQSDPWRMDPTPEEIVGTSPTGMTGPQPVTSGSPGGSPPDKFDLCAEHPDIIACQVFKPDELEPMPVPNKEVPLALNAEGGFPTGGSCPQPKQVQLMGQTFAFSMQPLCDFATGIKPLLIGFAWLSAALVFLGVARRES